MIPKIIHVSWIDNSILTSNHEFAVNCIQNINKLSPDWQLIVSNDYDIDSYLKTTLEYSDYLLIKNTSIVQKSDIWRLIKIYNEGGIYTDIDRLCNTSVNSIIDESTKCILPTCGDYNFSHDFMASAPRNPIYLQTLLLMLTRIRAGYNNVYFLGPQTYMHGITKTLFNQIIDVNPGTKVFNLIRSFVSTSSFIKTYVENPPYDTILYQPQNQQITFDHEQSKRDFYAKSNLKHWTGDW